MSFAVDAFLVLTQHKLRIPLADAANLKLPLCVAIPLA